MTATPASTVITSPPPITVTTNSDGPADFPPTAADDNGDFDALYSKLLFDDAQPLSPLTVDKSSTTLFDSMSHDIDISEVFKAFDSSTNDDLPPLDELAMASQTVIEVRLECLW